MRNIHEREREKIMMGGFNRGGGEGYHESEQEKRERELGEGLSEWELSEHSGVSEQELNRLKTTTPQRVFYIVVAIVLLLLLIVGIVGANWFHWS
jgi:hypothetical protein